MLFTGCLCIAYYFNEQYPKHRQYHGTDHLLAVVGHHACPDVVSRNGTHACCKPQRVVNISGGNKGHQGRYIRGKIDYLCLGGGAAGVHPGSPCENQNQADYRLPVFLELPIKHRTVIHEPMLEQIDIRKYLATGKIEGVTCGGESGPDARVCDFSWILDSMEQCVEYDVPFWFKQTGAMFKKGNKVYLIDRKAQMSQAQKAGVNYKC